MASRPAAEFTFRVENGDIGPEAARNLVSAIRQLDGKRVTLSLREVKRRRSNDQNAYLWGVVYPAVVDMFRACGNMVDVDDVHDFCKLRVAKLGQVFVTPEGEVVKSIGSTAKLSTKEMTDYIESIRAWAAQFGCDIPDPSTLNEGDK